MKRALLIAAGLGVVVLGAVFLYPKPVDRASTPAASAAGEATEAAAPKKGKAPARRLIPNQLPHEAAAAAAAEDSAPPSDDKAGGTSSVDEEPQASALVGMTTRPMDDGLREKLEVPNDSQIGYGVVVDEIHPDSPAAEVFMRRNDVIVRANLKKVDNLADLQKHVGDRGHTLVTISRDGQLMQMVLKKPYRGK